jgi:polyhydroxybutyrate depolymerase
MSSTSSSQSSSQASGCGKTFTSGDIKGLTVKDGAGRDRSFDINVSPDYASNTGASVIFNFHGNGGTSEGSATTGFQYAVAEMHDQAISVFPQGIWWENYGVGWEESCNGYDMFFFDNILKYLNENYCINSDRVFVSGFSWGGDMTNALACCRGDKIKSVATVSGPERINSSCPTNKWPVTWMRYGTSDGAYSQNMFEDTRQFYIQKLGCSTNSTPLNGDSQCSVYSDCTTPLTVCARPIGHSPLSYPEVQQLWQYWRSLP